MTECEQDTLLFYSFRYALGRMTYAVHEVVELLIKYKNILSTNHLGLIIKEIQYAIENGSAGMDCDIRDWKRLLEELQK